MTNRERLAAAFSKPLPADLTVRHQILAARRRPALTRLIWWVREIFGRLPG